MASTFKRKTKTKVVVASNDDDGASSGSDTATAPSTSSLLGLSGTKAWTGGITLTSSGLRDLDGILGGGQPLGTCIFIEEDRWTRSLASTIIRYWCAEALSQGQHLMIPTAEEKDDDDTIDGFGSLTFSAEEEKHETQYLDRPIGPSKQEVVQFLHTLPFNLHWEKQQKQQRQRMQQQQQQGNALNASSSGIIMESLQEEEEEEEEDDDDAKTAQQNEEGLKIAWQYRKDVQQKRMGHDGTASSKSSLSSSDIYCHSYDLSRQLGSQLEQQQIMSPLEELVDMNPLLRNFHQEKSSSSSTRSSCGFRLYQGLIDLIQTKLKEQQGRRKVIRLLLYHHNPDTLSIALPLLLVQIRLLQLPVVVMVCLQPWTASSSSSSSSKGQQQRRRRHLINLHRASDVVFQTEGFAARSIYPPPPEFRHLHGVLLVRKISTWTAPTAIGVGGGHYTDLTISKRPPANIYGLKRDRRKLNIPLLHIPPEDHTEGGGSVAGGGVRSGAGRPSAGSATSKKTTTTTSTGGGGCGSGGGGGNSLLDF